MSKTRGSTWVNSKGETHYKMNKGYYLEKARIRKNKIKEYLKNIKLEAGCIDCGYNKCSEALDFDHLPKYEKHFDLANAPIRGFSMEKIERELKKCEVVCATCHRERTYNRLNNIAS